MIELLQPWVLLLLGLPLLAWWLLPPADVSSGAALRVPFYARFTSLRGSGSGVPGCVSDSRSITLSYVWGRVWKYKNETETMTYGCLV